MTSPTNSHLISPLPDALKNTHGGARPGAGRKPTPRPDHRAEGHTIQSAHERCAQRLPQTLDELEQLAQGVPVVRERWVCAGTLTLGKGAQQRPAFPHLPPEQLVLVSRTTASPKPEARAVLYLADRVLGRLTSSDEALIEEQIHAELALLVEHIQTRFTPDFARLILTTLSAPEEPPAPVEAPEENSLVQQEPVPVTHPDDTNQKDEVEPLPQNNSQPALITVPTPLQLQPKKDTFLPPIAPNPQFSTSCTSPKTTISPPHPCETKMGDMVTQTTTIVLLD